MLEVLCRANHPVLITTKSSLVERDLDVLAPMAERGLVRVYLSIGSLDHGLAAQLEPRATAPRRRMQTLARLVECGVPCGVICAPVIPVLNEHELEGILEQAAGVGVQYAGYDPRGLVDSRHKIQTTGFGILTGELATGSIADLPEGSSTVLCGNRGGYYIYLSEKHRSEHCIAGCVIVHEKQHVDDIFGLNPLVCMDKDDKHTLAASGRLGSWLELQAYQAELQCLEEDIGDLNCDEPCLSKVKNEIKFVQAKIRGYSRKLRGPLPPHDLIGHCSGLGVGSGA